MEFRSDYVDNAKELFDYLIFGKINTEEFSNNQKIIEEFGRAVEEIKELKSGYGLLTVDIKNKRSLILVSKNKPNSWKSQGFTVYHTTEITSMENPVSFKIHEINPDVDINDLIQRVYDKGMSRKIDAKDTVSILVTKTLDGYVVSQKKLTEVIDKLQPPSNSEGTPANPLVIINANKERRKDWDAVPGGRRAEEILTEIREIIPRAKDKVLSKVRSFTEKLKCDKLVCPIDVGSVRAPMDMRSLNSYPNITLGIVREVIEVNNKRMAKVDVYTVNNRSHTYAQYITSKKSTDSARVEQIVYKDAYKFPFTGYSTSIVETIPYNYLDKGRVFVALGSGSRNIMTLVGKDPAVDADHERHLLDAIESYLEEDSTSYFNAEGGGIRDTMKVNGRNEILRMDLYNYIPRGSGRVLTIRDIMKAMKTMVDEYKFRYKRQSSEGKDLKVTDEIVYRHKDGAICYKDFSIQVDDESVKSAMYDSCNRNVLPFYRGEVTEEQIITQISNTVFVQLRNILEGWSYGEIDIKLKLNNAVDLQIKRGKNGFTYVNGQRFNKNEVVAVVREMSCYRDQETADKFLQTIGKVGLSVYMGITAGYKIKDRIYRFKKKKGRSKYVLTIDDIEIEIKGKKILNELYKIATDRSWADRRKLDSIIFDSAQTAYDYVKYKFLIDESYKAFMNRSKEYLEKKVKETDSEFVRYHDDNRKRMLDGIKVKGTSGKNYVIAYDAQESFVFMSPNKEGTHYTKGKYICMIDQSSIKSNIGYDTVISKLLSLKNDSVIASQIYNLEEELGK